MDSIESSIERIKNLNTLRDQTFKKYSELAEALRDAESNSVEDTEQVSMYPRKRKMEEEMSEFEKKLQRAKNTTTTTIKKEEDSRPAKKPKQQDKPQDKQKEKQAEELKNQVETLDDEISVKTASVLEELTEKAESYNQITVGTKNGQIMKNIAELCKAMSVSDAAKHASEILKSTHGFWFDLITGSRSKIYTIDEMNKQVTGLFALACMIYYKHDDIVTLLSKYEDFLSEEERAPDSVAYHTRISIPITRHIIDFLVGNKDIIGEYFSERSKIYVTSNSKNELFSGVMLYYSKVGKKDEELVKRIRLMIEKMRVVLKLNNTQSQNTGALFYFEESGTEVGKKLILPVLSYYMKELTLRYRHGWVAHHASGGNFFEATLVSSSSIGGQGIVNSVKDVVFGKGLEINIDHYICSYLLMFKNEIKRRLQKSDLTEALELFSKGFSKSEKSDDRQAEKLQNIYEFVLNFFDYTQIHLGLGVKAKCNEFIFKTQPKNLQTKRGVGVYSWILSTESLEILAAIQKQRQAFGWKEKLDERLISCDEESQTCSIMGNLKTEQIQFNAIRRLWSKLSLRKNRQTSDEKGMVLSGEASMELYQSFDPKIYKSDKKLQSIMRRMIKYEEEKERLEKLSSSYVSKMTRSKDIQKSATQNMLMLASDVERYDHDEPLPEELELIANLKENARMLADWNAWFESFNKTEGLLKHTKTELSKLRKEFFKHTREKMDKLKNVVEKVADLESRGQSDIPSDGDDGSDEESIDDEEPYEDGTQASEDAPEETESEDSQRYEEEPVETLVKRTTAFSLGNKTYKATTIKPPLKQRFENLITKFGFETSSKSDDKRK